MSSAFPTGVDQAPRIIHPTWTAVNTSTARTRVRVGTALPRGKSPVERTSVVGMGASSPVRRGGTTSYWGGDGSSLNQPKMQWQLEMLLNDQRASGRRIASITHSLTTRYKDGEGLRVTRNSTNVRTWNEYLCHFVEWQIRRIDQSQFITTIRWFVRSLSPAIMASRRNASSF